MTASSIVGAQVAVLLITASGLCVAIRRQRMGMRLFLAGAAVACGSAIIATRIHEASYVAFFEEIVAWIGVVGVVAAIFEARHVAVRLIIPPAVLLALNLAWPTLALFIDGLSAYLWIVPVILIAPFLAYFIVSISLKHLRDFGYGSRSAHSFKRVFSRVLDRLTGDGRHRRHRDRHIGDTAPTGKRTNAGGRK